MNEACVGESLVNTPDVDTNPGGHEWSESFTMISFFQPPHAFCTLHVFTKLCYPPSFSASVVLILPISHINYGVIFDSPSLGSDCAYPSFKKHHPDPIFP